MGGDGSGGKRSRQATERAGNSTKETRRPRTGSIDPVLKDYGLTRPDVTSPRDYFVAWKRNIPLLYDTILHHSLNWASLTCAFDVRPGVRDEENPWAHTQIYFSSRTDAKYSPGTNLWSSGQPSLLFVGNVDINLNNTSRRKYLARFAETNQSSRITIEKRIIHPGEVNRVRPSVLRPGIIATHSDSPYVFIWDVENQPDRSGKNGGSAIAASAAAAAEAAKESGDDHQVSDAVVAASKSQKLTPQHASIPDLTLAGHSKKAEYALDFSATSDHILSGGSDGDLCLWNLRDAESALMHHGKTDARSIYVGHSGPIEGCAFNPHSEGNNFISVGDDKLAAFWDARKGTNPTHLLRIHTSDVNCCAWNAHDEYYILTGSSDKHICLLDTRKFSSSSTVNTGDPGKTPGVVRRFQGHESAVLNVRWSPHHRHYFASTDEQKDFLIWDLGLNEDLSENEPMPFFKHAGHQAPASDFDWSLHDPWGFLSCSDDSLMESPQGGGTLQYWRVLDLISRSNDDDFREQLAISSGRG